MDKLAPKRGASPGYSPAYGPELLPPLRRVQSAGPVASDKCEQQTTWDDLEHWRGREEAHRPSADGIAAVQLEVTTSMRRMLVDWLGEVRDEFRLHTETLFLAVAYLDRYLAAKSVPRGRFQLLGLTCLWVAAKFEEVYPPPLKSCLAMAENMYTADEMRACEKEHPSRPSQPRG
ncbi:Cyclin-AB-1 [Tetrabaena socialis]|uniref:Cyclin-AB-1 n=1 Tax=Tetrabaena socialis TaxID=47790 RepID=A0A2J7ZJE8_9CHLO|nr:Cyclin-AB-1 [Tetrabaena socialis]|eukprot:PNH00380.1 Cyclin-AB-1 [Tetrabaena socialis]